MNEEKTLSSRKAVIWGPWSSTYTNPWQESRENSGQVKELEGLGDQAENQGLQLWLDNLWISFW